MQDKVKFKKAQKLMKISHPVGRYKTLKCESISFVLTD